MTLYQLPAATLLKATSPPVGFLDWSMVMCAAKSLYTLPKRELSRNKAPCPVGFLQELNSHQGVETPGTGKQI